MTSKRNPEFGSAIRKATSLWRREETKEVVMRPNCFGFSFLVPHLNSSCHGIQVSDSYSTCTCNQPVFILQVHIIGVLFSGNWEDILLFSGNWEIP